MANAKAQAKEETTPGKYTEELLGPKSIGHYKPQPKKRKRTTKRKCSEADVHKILAHEKEWSNKDYKWIAKRINRTGASVRTVITTLREEGRYPKTLREIARNVAQKQQKDE